MESLRARLNKIEREEILDALVDSNWIMAKAARRLGITERMIGYKIRKYGISIKEVRFLGSNIREALGCTAGIKKYA